MDSKRTFLIHIVESQNATWQGSITWLEEKETKHFRSLLEMIKLIDTAIDENALIMKGGSFMEMAIPPWRMPCS